MIFDFLRLMTFLFFGLRAKSPAFSCSARRDASNELSYVIFTKIFAFWWKGSPLWIFNFQMAITWPKNDRPREISFIFVLSAPRSIEWAIAFSDSAPGGKLQFYLKKYLVNIKKLADEVKTRAILWFIAGDHEKAEPTTYQMKRLN
jgi:hypothetical protein